MLSISAEAAVRSALFAARHRLRYPPLAAARLVEAHPDTFSPSAAPAVANLLESQRTQTPLQALSKPQVDEFVKSVMSVGSNSAG
ncbi:MAG: hypothetical protein IPK79_02315 [Vampirovibrionales bacterium]|nr:hypothetical protein [Vampirovibrionales bacterium]